MAQKHVLIYIDAACCTQLFFKSIYLTGEKSVENCSSRAFKFSKIYKKLLKLIQPFTKYNEKKHIFHLDNSRKYHKCFEAFNETFSQSIFFNNLRIIR